MRKLILISILIVIPILLFSLLSELKLKLSVEGLNDSPCIWPLCTQREFIQEAYVNGIYLDKYSHTYKFSMSYVDDNLKPHGVYQGTAKKPNYLTLTIPIVLDEIEYYIQGKSVEQQVFLDESFGAKVSVKGLMESHFGIDYAPINYKITSLDLLETLQEVNSLCTECKTYSDDYFSFSYSPDWKIVYGSHGLVTLRREKFFERESPTDCTANGTCDCNDLQQSCEYEMSFAVVPDANDPEISVFSGKKQIKFTQGDNAAGHMFQIEYPDNNFVYGNFKIPYQESPFKMEYDSNMPYIIFSTLSLK